MDDSKIIEMLIHRNEQAIAEIRQKYEKLCFYTAGKILSQREDIEECVSEAYYAIWNSASAAEINNLRIYLCKIVKNFAVNRLEYNTAQKRSSDFALSLEELTDCIPDGSDIEDSINFSMLGAAVSRFLRTEKRISRNIFIRRYWYCDSLSEIAEMYNISEKNAAVQLHRTKKKLREFLKKEDYINEST